MHLKQNRVVCFGLMNSFENVGICKGGIFSMYLLVWFRFPGFSCVLEM